MTRFNSPEIKYVLSLCVIILSVSIIHIAGLAYFIRAGTRHGLRSGQVRSMARVVVGLVIMLPFYYALGWCIQNYPTITKFVFGIIFLGTGPVFLIFVTRSMLSFRGEWREVNFAPIVKFDDRKEIESLFRALHSSYIRSRLVQRIEDYHRKNGTKPSGQWSTGAAPNLFDRASNRLSQLDEIWTGLER